MASGKEIKTQISSIGNTQKITSAMEMVAASKMKKAQERMEASRPYADTIRKVIGHVARGNLEYRHPFMEERQVKRVGYIIVSTDRGLCGGLNGNEFKKVVKHANEWKEQDVEADFAAIGSKGTSFFKRFGKLKAQVSGMGDKPELKEITGSIQVMLDAFEEGKIDRLYVVFNSFTQGSRLIDNAGTSTFLPSYFHYAYLFLTDRLVYMLDSLVRVTRRVDLTLYLNNR